MTVQAAKFVPVDTKVVVFIKTDGVVRNAFADSAVRLYIPIDHLGNVVDPVKAERMECWVSIPEQRRKHLPEILSEAKGVLMHSLIKHVDGGQYTPLKRTVAVATIKALIDWLPTLHRHPEGDVAYFEVAEVPFDIISPQSTTADLLRPGMTETTQNPEITELVK